MFFTPPSAAGEGYQNHMEELRRRIDMLSAWNQKLVKEEKMLRLICETSSSAFLYVNFAENSVRTLGNWDFFFPDTEIKEMQEIAKLYDEVEGEYQLPLKKLLFFENTEMKSDSGVVRLKDKRTWVECEVTVIYDGEHGPTDKVIRFKNVSKLQNQNEELTYMAYYDMLTGLYNRNYFVRLLADFVRRAEEEQKIISVMFLDIDDFRKINDGLGIIVGDEVVQQLGQFLSGFNGSHTVVSHFNADIYCIAVYNPEGDNTPEKIFGAVQERLRSPFLLSTGQKVSISLSAGVAEYPEAAKTSLELINCAEIVMFRAKGMGRNTIQYFNAPILNDFIQSVTLENRLKGAVFEQNFTLNFQPQYFIENNKLRGVEVLIRWKDVDGKMISPSVFIPLAEKNGAIVPIGTWVIEESIRCFSGWKKKYGTDMLLSLNVSAIQYGRNDFVDNVLGMIERYQVDPREIELEITESVLIENFQEITEKLKRLRAHGIRISLDDFGTGYSSLSYLKELPVDTLKIDKSFVDAMLNDSNSKIIIDSIVYMVKKLGFETIAEGVETEEQLNYLKEIGCDCIQGFLQGRPLSSDDVEKLLKKIG